MRIQRVAVLGAGTMGSQIAAHFANASVAALLFDLPGLASKALEKLKKMEPPPLFHPSYVSWIEPLEFDRDFQRLRNVDWIIEAIIEEPEAKRSLLQSILPHLQPETIVSSNTSGIPLSMLAAEMPPDFKKRWLGTHFFNPPRYLKLLEIIPTADTDPAIVSVVADFAEKWLGKGIVYAKDTPNFIANRLGTFAALRTIQLMLEENFTIEEIDVLTGPIVGHPKTGTFRLFDLVGIDVLGLVAKNLYRNVPQDEQRETFKLPALLEQMISRGWLGSKSTQGFYKKQGTQLLALDPRSLEYRPVTKANFPSVEMVRNLEDPADRIAALIRSKDRAGMFVWKTFSALLAYAANRIPEISDDIVNVDQAMKWGFGWSHGPFEIWDKIGVMNSVTRMKEEGLNLPAWMDRLLEKPDPRFYKISNGEKYCWDIGAGDYQALPKSSGVLILQNWKQEHGVVKKNAGASLVDLGDGILCLEFHSKMNAIGADTMQMVRASLDIMEKDFAGMMIANQGENFSVGANLMLLLLEAQEGNWEELDQTVRLFQQMNLALRYSSKPVIAAPFHLTLGGGCEIAMSADAIHSAAEVYTGLVEVGVGLIPAGTGTKEIYVRNLNRMPEGADPLPYLKRAFETIALAKVSRSAPDARKIGYFTDSDTFSMNTDHLLQDAKNVVLQISQTYRSPGPRRDILLTGRAGYAYLQTGIYLMREAGYISEYDSKIGEKIAWVMTGGDFTEPVRVEEQYILDLEREAFLSLLGERKTQDRIREMLKTGKPLRN